MRILILNPTFGDKNCGIRDALVPVARRLLRDHEIYIGTTKLQTNQRYPLEPGLKLLEIEKWDRRGIETVVDFCISQKIDVVDIQYAVAGYSGRNGAICSLPRLLKNHRIPSVLSIHELAPPKFHPRVSHALNVPYALVRTGDMIRSSTIIVTFANWIHSLLSKLPLGGNKSHLRLVLLGPTLWDQEDPEFARVNLEGKHIVCFGFVSPKRDCETVLKAVHAALRHVDGLVVTFSGEIRPKDIAYQRRMDELASSLGVRVKWTGGLSASDLREVICSASVLLITQRSTKYFARGGIDFNSSGLRNGTWAGLPIITTNGPFVPDAIQNAVALYKPGDYNDLSKRIVEVISKKKLQLSDGSRELAKRFNHTTTTTLVAQAYSDAVKVFQ